jgi:acetylornithine deacetylase
MVPSIDEMIRALVAMPSASSFDPSRDQGNRGVINLLASWLDDLGCEVRLQTLQGEPDRANLVATLGQGEDGLVLSGHSDTVGCEQGWQHDPYGVTQEAGRLYGLGIADMKAFFAIAIEAMRRVDRARLRAPVILVATADEECAMQGARALVAGNQVQGRFALIGEPTGWQPVRMHKGMLMESIVLRGRSGHSSVPAGGNSALEGMVRVAQALLLWRERLQKDFRDTEFEVPFPTLNLGTIHGGDHPNRICGACEMQVDLRPLPGMAVDQARAALRATVHDAVEGCGLQVEISSLYPGTEPMRTPVESLVVQAAQQLTGQRAGTAAYGTEAPHYAALGFETLLLGPGDIAQAHQPDEYLPIDRIEPGVALLRGMIERLCMG